MQRRFSLLILVLVSLAFAQTAVQPTGAGSYADPYQIDSLPNLYWLAMTPSA